MISEKIKELINIAISKVIFVKIEQISSDSHLINDLGADDLDLIELVCEIEQEFNFEFSDSDCLSIETVGDIYKIVSEKIE